MGRKLVIAGEVALAVLGVGLIAVGWHMLTRDPFAAESLAAPPDILAPKDLAGRRPVFDGRTTDGLIVSGHYHIEGGTLEIGSPQPTKLTLPTPLSEGEQLEFDFFQQGKAGAKLVATPMLLAPQPPHAEYREPFPIDLNLSGNYYRRWHHVRVTASRTDAEANATFEAEYNPIRDDFGSSGDAIRSMPARGGVQYHLVFEVGPGAKLFLRNAVVGPAKAKADVKGGK